MDKDKAQSIVVHAVAKITGEHPNSHLGDADKKLRQDLHFDSLDVVELVLIVEETVAEAINDPRFDIPDEVSQEHFSGDATVQQAIDWLVANA